MPEEILYNSIYSFSYYQTFKKRDCKFGGGEGRGGGAKAGAGAA